jgi:hypothetical protein
LRTRIGKAEAENFASIQRIKEFMKCALNPQPAAAALRFFYSICASKGVFEISRAESSGFSKQSAAATAAYRSRQPTALNCMLEYLGS